MCYFVGEFYLKQAISPMARQQRYKNDKCGCKSFLKQSKTAPFSFENRLVWTGIILVGLSRETFLQPCIFETFLVLIIFQSGYELNYVNFTCENIVVFLQERSHGISWVFI